jgi:excisionase family DNA binding protein
MSELMDTKQAAKYLNLKRNTLEVWRVQGSGPPFCKFGRSVRYRRTDLDAFIERNLVDSTSQTNAER